MRNYASNIDSRMFDFKEYYDKVAAWLPDNCRLVEVGIADAASATYLCEAILNLGKTIDKFFWVDDFSYGKYDQLKVVYQHIIKAAIGEYVDIIPTDSIKASKMFNGNSLDFVFLDSSHQYSATKKEIKAWYDKVKDNGIIAGHDATSDENPGVSKAVYELLPFTITRKTIDEPTHYQEFEPEPFLNIEKTEKGMGVWWVQKKFYFKP